MAKIIQFILKNWKYISFVLPYVFKLIKKIFTKKIKIMEDTRKGFFNEEGHKIIDDLIPLEGIKEIASDLAIKYGDDIGLEMLKKKIVEKYGAEILPDIYEVIDTILGMLKEISKTKVS